MAGSENGAPSRLLRPCFRVVLMTLEKGGKVVLLACLSLSSSSLSANAIAKQKDPRARIAYYPKSIVNRQQWDFLVD